MMRERINFVSDLWEQSAFFFVAPDSYDKQTIKKRWKDDTPQRLRDIVTILVNIPTYDKNEAHDKVIEYITNNELNMGQILNSLRLALVGAPKGPDLFDIIQLLGLEECKNRIEKAILVITNSQNSD